jgi:hypothetical protein
MSAIRPLSKWPMPWSFWRGSPGPTRDSTKLRQDQDPDLGVGCPDRLGGPDAFEIEGCRWANVPDRQVRLQGLDLCG